MVLYRQYRRASQEGMRSFAETMRGNGVRHPEYISGFSGLFFSVGDVYLSDDLAPWAKLPELAAFLDEIIARFSREDYGEVSQMTRFENTELRWLGNGSGLFGRYPHRDTVVCIITLDNYTYIHEECDVTQVPNRI